MTALPARVYNRATNPSFQTGSGSTAVLRTNLCTNPSAETNTTGWTGVSCTVTRTTAFPQMVKSGTSIFHITSDGTSPFPYAYMGSIAVTDNEWIGYKAFLASEATGNIQVRLYASFRNSGGSEIGSASTTYAKAAFYTGAYHSLTAQAPVGTVNLIIYLQFRDGDNTSSNVPNGTRLWADVIQVHKTPYTQAIAQGFIDAPYFDGSTAAGNDRTFAWTGTAHNSTSTETVSLVKNFTYISNQTINFMSTQSPNKGTSFARCIFLSTAAAGINLSDSFIADGVERTAVLRVRASRNMTVQPRWRTSSGSATVNVGAPIALTANVWTDIRMNGTPSLGGVASGPSLLINASAGQQANDTLDIDWHLHTEGNYAGDIFDGDGGDPDWYDVWVGTAHDSESYRDVYGLWVDAITTGTPHCVLSVLHLGATPSTTKVVRTDGKTTWPVPGWLGRRTVDADTGEDWAVPLGVPVTYTLFKDGVAVSSKTVTLNVDAGDIMDPMDPLGAIKVKTVAGDPTALTLGYASMKAAKYENTGGDREYPLGARFPIVRPGTRAAAQDVPFVLQAYSNATSDALLAMVEGAPILLIRSLPSWGSVPTAVYTDAPVEEAPFNRGTGGQFTQWKIDASAVAPVTRPVTATKVTNGDVQTNLAGRTHTSIQSASGTKRWVEILANPLGLGA